MTPQPACAVLGLGNVLMHDDGFGPYAARSFSAAYEPHPDVAVMDVGTPGLDLVPYLMGYEAVIVLDTIRLDASPGTMKVYGKPVLLSQPPKERLSPHDPGLAATLRLLELQGTAPHEVVLVGVVPEAVNTQLGLSDAVLASVPDALSMVAAALTRLGRPVQRRAEPDAPDLWWLRTAPPSHFALSPPLSGR